MGTAAVASKTAIKTYHSEAEKAAQVYHGFTDKRVKLLSILRAQPLVDGSLFRSCVEPCSNTLSRSVQFEDALSRHGSSLTNPRL